MYYSHISVSSLLHWYLIPSETTVPTQQSLRTLTDTPVKFPVSSHTQKLCTLPKCYGLTSLLILSRSTCTFFSSTPLTISYLFPPLFFSSPSPNLLEFNLYFVGGRFPFHPAETTLPTATSHTYNISYTYSSCRKNRWLISNLPWNAFRSM